MRIALGIEYDGHGFVGWQFQDNGPSVQEAVEKALTEVADEPIRVVCAGRTDTGVHALGQVVHFDTSAERSMRAWIFGANANLPKGVAVTWAEAVSDDFHARFSARVRRYRYVIFNRPVRPTFLAYRVAWQFRPLDQALMAQGAQHLIGEHDFSAFRAAGSQSKTPVRRMDRVDVWRKDDMVFIEVAANAFLHHMVRNIAGVLMTVGTGEQQPDWVKEVLEGQDRTLAGVTAPAHGLYLLDVDYSPDFDLPRVSQTQLVW